MSEKPKPSELALTYANCVMPFILHPPASKYLDEVRDDIARSFEAYEKEVNK